MNRNALRLITVITMLIGTLGMYVPGRATSPTALTSGGVVNIAHFFKPPNLDAATAARTFGTIILTNGDHDYRNQLSANGYSSTIPQYFRSEAIYDPGSCTASTLNNTVAYNTGDFCWISQNHPDWFLLDAYGQRISVTPGGSYMRMDPGNPGWRQYFLSRVLESQNQYGWSALFLDNVEGSLSKFYGPKPVKYPDNLSYQNAVQGFLQYLNVNYSQVYGRPVFGNIVARDSDAVWFNYLQYLSGAMQERFAVDWYETSYLSVNRWLNDLSMMERSQASGKYVILVAPGNQEDLNREKFSFATYLLVSNGKAAFRYSTDDAYRDTWLYDNYNIDLGTPVGPRYAIGSLWRRDFTKGCVVVDAVNHSATIASTTGNIADVFIGGTPMGGCYDSSGQSQRASFTNVDGGPVKIVSTSGNPIISSLRINLKRNSTFLSYSEFMGIPASKLTDTYLFPWYNNASAGGLSSQLRFANMGSAATEVTVNIGGTSYGPYHLNPNESQRVSFDNVDSGPVRVKSSGGVPIIASMRINLKNMPTYSSYTEFLGLSASSTVGTEYTFPWYNNSTAGGLSSQLRFGNVGNAATSVTVKIGGVAHGPYSLNPSQSQRVTFDNIDSGPIEVSSSGGVPIIASMRVNLKRNPTYSSYTEFIGQPGSVLTETRYLFPWYNNATAGGLSSHLRFVNVGNVTTTVQIKIGGVTQSNSYTLAPNQSAWVSLNNVDDGPVEVFSSAGVPIIASMQIALKSNTFYSSYLEFMGLSMGSPLSMPADELSNTYWFPWYSNATAGGLSSQLRFGLP